MKKTWANQEKFGRNNLRMMSLEAIAAIRAGMDFSDELRGFDPTLSLEEARNPPASWYKNQDFFEAELQSVFAQNPFYAGRVEELPSEGDFLARDFASIPFILCRSGGRIRAFHNSCTHHGTCVADGHGNTASFVCPYHGWTFDLEGRLKKAPMAGALRQCKGGALNLQEFGVRTVGPFIFVCPQRAFEFEQSFSDIEKLLTQRDFEKMHFVTARDYEIDCNWKVYIDNYLDGGYHVPHMHRDLASDLNIDDYKTEIFKNYSLQSVESKADVGRLAGKALYLWLYPQFVVNRYGPWMDINSVEPLGAQRCRVRFEYFHEEKKSAEDLKSQLEDSHQVQREDIEICHWIQKGLRSPVFKPGVYAPAFEKAMYSFHKCLYQDLMGGKGRASVGLTGATEQQSSL